MDELHLDGAQPGSEQLDEERITVEAVEALANHDFDIAADILKAHPDLGGEIARQTVEVYFKRPEDAATFSKMDPSGVGVLGMFIRHLVEKRTIHTSQ